MCIHHNFLLNMIIIIWFGMSRGIFILVTEHIFITDSKVYCVSLKSVQT